MKTACKTKKRSRDRRRIQKLQRRWCFVERMEPRVLLYGGGTDLPALPSLEADGATGDFAQTFTGTKYADRFRTGEGRQLVVGKGGQDHFLSFGDAGEPDPAQTKGSEGRVNEPVPLGRTIDVFVGGAGADTFEFVPLINATQETLDQYRNHNRGTVNWNRVAGENDNVHEHWVEGVGKDVIVDYNEEEGDQIKVTGHTVSLADIEYGQDAFGDYSRILVRSDQGGAGAHDGDPLGAIMVYGDKVTEDDVEFTHVNYGIDRLEEADRLAEHNGGGTREIISGTDDDSFSGGGRVRDLVTLGRGSQELDTQAGNDRFMILGDAGEPDPAQTEGSEGRVNDPVDPDLAADVVRGGLGRDVFIYRPLINAKDEIIEKHTRNNGTVNRRRVAGENDNVHDHWVEGIGNETLLDFDKGDGDQIHVQGHTVSLAGIDYDEDGRGSYSLIRLASDQGGRAHDGDSLGAIKVYGDRVNAEDVTIRADVFYGIDRLDAVDTADNSQARDAGLYGSPSDAFEDYAPDHNARNIFFGTNGGDRFRTGAGTQLVVGQGGKDHFLSFGDAGEPDPAQTKGSQGRVNKPVPLRKTIDVFVGGAGADTFEFVPLINATQEVLDQYRNHNSGTVNWNRVAGENDNVHDHWVEGVGKDVIVDYNEEEGDQIKVTGHTVSLAGIEYGSNAFGDYSRILVRSDQGGAGAHDGDPLGDITVYGDKVTEDDVEFTGANYGVDRLREADRLAEHNGGGTREIISGTDGDSFSGGGRVRDLVTLGRGSQEIDTQAGNDRFMILGDAGEPDPAQTKGSEGRVNDPVDPDLAADVVRGGLGRDVFIYRPLINAKDEIIEKHTRSNGTVNWRRVAGENDNVHDHWVEGIGKDTLLDFDKGDGDQIHVQGHTASLAGIEYGEDERGSYSLIRLVSDQGGAGAHDGDSLGSIKVYGDRVNAEDVTIKAGVFYGIDRLDAVDAADNSGARDAGLYGSHDPPGTNAPHGNDRVGVDSGSQAIEAVLDLTFGERGQSDAASTAPAATREASIWADAVEDVFASLDDLLLPSVTP